VPDSPAGHGHELNSPSVLQESGRRSMETNDNSSGSRETANASWTSRQGKASASMLPPARGNSNTDLMFPFRSARDQPPWYAENEGDPDGWAPGGRRLYHRKDEEADRRPGRATMAPHSSGALRPLWKAGRGAEARGAGSKDVALVELPAARRWPTARRGEGGTRVFSERRAEICHDETRQFLGSRQEVEWHPYPDEFHDFDDDNEGTVGHRGRGPKPDEAHGVRKNDSDPRRSRSRRKATRSRRAKAV